MGTPFMLEKPSSDDGWEIGKTVGFEVVGGLFRVTWRVIT